MIKTICLGLFFIPLLLLSQDSEGTFITDKKNHCAIWFKHPGPIDSVTWSGKSKNGYADGKGVLIGYANNKEISRYSGYLRHGKPNGYGKFSHTHSPFVFEGNFIDGEPMFLNQTCISHLKKNTLYPKDSLELYVNDNNVKQLYYHAIIPEKEVKGAIILMPGTWETTEHLLSSNAKLCELAYKNNLAVVALSINQRLTLLKEIQGIMNTLIADCVTRYRIPKDKIVMGGWSMGGLFALRYTELSYQDSSLTAIQPAAVFSCDGPCDLVNIYDMFQRKLLKVPNSSEPMYGIQELEKYCSGTPAEQLQNYQYYSCYSHALRDGGNAKYLNHIPVRIYDDVDPVWWLENRKLDMYEMNALDQSAMILLLNEMGNERAEFINPFGKGYRIEGNRHPHSWSIVEPNDCMKWVLKSLNF